MFFRLLRFSQYGARVNKSVGIPETISFLRSGPYQLSAIVMHHGGSIHQGHYTTLCWEGGSGNEARYRHYDDDRVGDSMTWSAVRETTFCGSRLGVGSYVLVYVRLRYWGEGVGDGAERTPYLRDAVADAVAVTCFRGERVRR